MRTTGFLKHAIIGTLALLGSWQAQAAGLLSPADGSLPPLEIRDHQVTVTIEDGYAITAVEQTFHNPHARDLEAIYSFPVPAHSSVAEFTMWIDGKPVNGEVLEKKKARQIYEEEKQAGREAGITEKDSYRTFDISVSPVRAGQDTRIRLVYFQSTDIDTGIGRYVYPLEEGGVDEQKLAFWTANEKVMGSFRFDMKLRSGYPVDAVRVPNQGQANVGQLNQNEWTVSIDPNPALAANAGTGTDDIVNTTTATGAAPVFTLDKDIVVYWRLTPGLPGAVDLVAHKPDANGKGTFMLVVTPGDDLKPITEGSDWLFVLDTSGSMSGKYATLTDGVERALGKMRPNDRFRIVLFNSRASELTHGYVNATPENVKHYSQAVAQVQPNNGTNLYDGLKLGLDSLDADRTSAILLVTDGVANVGVTQQKKFLELVRQKDVRLFTFIMGNSSNRPLLEALTKHSGGFASSVSNSDDIVGQILSATSKVTHEALHGVKLDIKGVKTADLTPVKVGSLYRGQQLVVFGHYWGDGEADVTLEGKISGQAKQYNTRFAFPAFANINPEIERLWAYARIEDMMEEMEDFGADADIEQAIVDLGTEYSLVTDYTSMVVLRDEVFVARGIERKNQQRLTVEHAAQQQRAAQSVQPRRVDQQQPMFSQPRASHGTGGGAFDVTSLVILTLVSLVMIHRRRHAHN